MTTLAAQSALQANLTALGRRNPELARALQQVEPSREIELAAADDGAVTATLGGKALCSRRHPRQEAERLADTIDLLEHAVVVVCGFGLGYHVEAIARRAGKSGLVVVFEPDLALLRAVLERIDHSRWLADSLVLVVDDPTDRGALGRALEGAEAILAQGVAFLDHPASRPRLREQSLLFHSLFTEYMGSAKTTFLTTLMRSVDTIRNCVLNLDHYIGGSGIAELAGAAAGRLGIVVSAGPSLQRNLHLLAEPGVRDRCVIVAVQTALRPMLEAGVRPHFATALDYHEISRRFYEELDPTALADVTLIAEPKAHPIILDLYPGPVRCCGAAFLDRLLGEHARDMGAIKAGATVAHLAFYFAAHLGCRPIALIGQDLGFPDGLYYAPGTAIHEVWAPELGPFNTVEMMEWQRIVRHRTHLTRRTDVRGRSIYTDLQMQTYLQQFERDFAEARLVGLEVIDATEGGVVKQHTTIMPLAEVLAAHATRAVDPIAAPAGPDRRRMADARPRIAAVRRDVGQLRSTARRAASRIESMIAEQTDAAQMKRHFRKIDQYRLQVEERFEAFDLLNYLNQVGAFKRMKADRRLHLQSGLAPLQRQRAQLERDLVNVRWIADAAEELADLLAAGESLLDEPASGARRPAAHRTAGGAASLRAGIETGADATRRAASRLTALVAVDPRRNGLGLERSLADRFVDGRNVLQATLERLGRCARLDSIVLLVRGDDAARVESLIDRGAIDRPVELEPGDDALFGPEQRAIAAARLWSDTCWRGGIGGMSIYDEVLCPGPMSAAMERRGLTAALVAGPDWPLIDVSADGGCAAVIERHLEHPDEHQLVFTQAPPGLCGCVVGSRLMRELAQRNRLCTLGALLVYQPHAPQGDPIARDANVQIDHRVRRSLVRATFDTPRQRALLRRALDGHDDAGADSPAQIVERIEAAAADVPRSLPQHVILETGSAGAEPLTIDRARRLLEQLGAAGDAVLTLGTVASDPLQHPAIDELVGIARSAGVRGVHLRTALQADLPTLDRVLAAGVDVISVELHADRAETYRRRTGCDRFREVIDNIQHLVERRPRLTDHPPETALALPWIVPRIERSASSHEDIDSFFDRWQHTLGAALVEPAAISDDLATTSTPTRVLCREARRRMLVLSDGRVPVREDDVEGAGCVGSVDTTSLETLWAALLEHRGTNGTEVRWP